MFRAFFVARADGGIARRRPKACHPGASASRQGQDNVATSRTEGGERVHESPHRWCTQHRPPGVITQQAVKTIACGTPDDAA